MYHIAICDNNSSFIEYIENMLIKAGADRKDTYFYEFLSGESLLGSLEGPVCYDLLILNTELKGINGYRTAKVFCKKYPDAVLIFCSNHYSPSPELFQYNPFRYLVKSYSDHFWLEQLKQILKQVDKMLTIPCILGHYRYESIRVRISNILYIENAKRGSRIVVAPDCREAEFKNKILIKEKLAEMELSDFGFALAHNSYLVNLNHVEEVSSKYLVLDSGDILTVSKSRSKEFMNSFIENMTHKYSFRKIKYENLKAK